MSKMQNTWLDVEGIAPLEVFNRYLNEIRHPFSTIKGIAELLITGQVTVEEQIQWLTRISQTMDQMEELRLVVSKYVAKARKKP